MDHIGRHGRKSRKRETQDKTQRRDSTLCYIPQGVKLSAGCGDGGANWTVRSPSSEYRSSARWRWSCSSLSACISSSVSTIVAHTDALYWSTHINTSAGWTQTRSRFEGDGGRGTNEGEDEAHLLLEVAERAQKLLVRLDGLVLEVLELGTTKTGHCQPRRWVRPRSKGGRTVLRCWLSLAYSHSTCASREENAAFDALMSR